MIVGSGGTKTDVRYRVWKGLEGQCSSDDLWEGGMWIRAARHALKTQLKGTRYSRVKWNA